MARPTKNSCDYFTHDNDMRNHRKVKSLRNKFGIHGYGIWSMLLEYLTGIDGNEFEYSDLEFELMSGDFGVSVTEIRDVVDYCIRLEMLFNKNGFVLSESLNERLAPVYIKRGKAKEISDKQKRIQGKFHSNTVDTVVSATETPQSKEEYIKVNNTILNNGEFLQNSEQPKEVSLLPLKEEQKEIPPQVPQPPPKQLIGDGVLQNSCKDYHNKNPEKYTPPLYKAFINYWTAIVQVGTKKEIGQELWRTKKTWDLAGRLAYWKSNENKNFNNGKQPTSPVIEPRQGKEFKWK